jgi:cytochrome d ubiquinol oxidase subunit I
MMPSQELVDISRLQFAVTALYHFLFVPLTLGLSFLLVIMESVYVMTGKVVYRDMTQFWGKLFGINFALGVTTGLTMEFQFGTNWAYYSHYVGDIFGVPLAIEGLMAFFLESTFVGLFFFGWNKLSKVKHLMVTFMVALGSNLSALWILIANGWMQNPVGAEFNFHTMRMEMTSITQIFFNPVAQVKFVHTVSAGYVTASVFVLGISAYYLLIRRDQAFALRSIAVATGFGLASALSVIVLGDESGYTAGEVQRAKLATIEAAWHTEPAPASLTLFGIPNELTEQTEYAIRIPFLLGLIATRSVDEKVIGISELREDNAQKIRLGIIAYTALEKLRNGDTSDATNAIFTEHKGYLGYALLLKKYALNITNATAAQINLAARDSIPQVAPMFWTFRIMVVAGLMILMLLLATFYFVVKRTIADKKWLLKIALYSIPLPWIAAEMGWIVAEYGRQPWTISGILPTRMSTSNLDVTSVYISLAGFVGFYTMLLIAELYLMFKYARLGPQCLHTGRYGTTHGEQI